MRRGDICLIDFEPARGRGTGRARPAVIVSNDAANRTVEQNGKGVLTVVPVTSDTSRVFAFQVALPAAECGLVGDCTARCEQVRAVSPERVLHRIGAVPRQRMAELDAALRRHLAL